MSGLESYSTIQMLISPLVWLTLQCSLLGSVVHSCMYVHVHQISINYHVNYHPSECLPLCTFNMLQKVAGRILWTQKNDTSPQVKYNLTTATTQTTTHIQCNQGYRPARSSHVQRNQGYRPARSSHVQRNQGYGPARSSHVQCNQGYVTNATCKIFTCTMPQRPNPYHNCNVKGSFGFVT